MASTGQLVFYCDLGEYCVETPWPRGDIFEALEFRRVLVDFCVNLRPDSALSLLGEQVSLTRSLLKQLLDNFTYIYPGGGTYRVGQVGKYCRQ